MGVHPISAVLADIDGTLVTKDKVLTERAIQAVSRLRERGIVFTICSGRPPRGMRMLVEPLRLTMPMAAFNGGVIVLPDLSVLDERALPDYVVPAIVEAIEAHGLDVWIYSATDWYVRSRQAPRVDREASTSQSEPTVVPTFDGVLTGVVKIVGVSDDHDKVAACEAELQKTFGTQVSAARSQPYYLDVTHPTANKGTVIERLARYLKIPLEAIATIGDQPTDVLMFKRSGLSIAMGNASEDVQRQATHVTTSHEDEGFANAVDQFILPRAEPAGTDVLKATGQLHRLGQSLWLDNITRDLLSSGTLQHYIDDLSVTGLTSNPTIFEQAIKNSSAYDTAIAAKLAQGKSGEALFFELALEDLTRAADLFRPIYDRTNGMDGWVSLEVSPLLAYDTAATIAAAKSSLRQGRSSEPDDQDSRDRRRTARHRGGHLRRHPDQRHAAVLPRALLRRRRSVPARHRTPDRCRAEAGRRLGGLGLRQPLGLRGRRHRARRAAQSARHRHGQAHLQGVPIGPQLAAVAARLQRRRPAAAAPVGQHGHQGSRRCPTSCTSRRWPRHSRSTRSPRRR